MPWQVTDKDADGVLDEIESAIFQAAASILAGQGFSYRCSRGAIDMVIDMMVTQSSLTCPWRIVWRRD